MAYVKVKSMNYGAKQTANAIAYVHVQPQNIMIPELGRFPKSSSIDNSTYC